MVKKSTEEIRKTLQDHAKRLIGRNVELHVDEGLENSGELLKQQVRIAGILMPEGTFSMEDVYQINDNIVNKGTDRPLHSRNNGCMSVSC